MSFKFNVKSITPIADGGGGGEGGVDNYNQLKGKPQINGITLTGNKTTKDLKIIASEIANIIADFQILTGLNIQDCLKQIDTKLALGENFASVLLSLDVLNKDVGGVSQVPLQSLQTEMHDGRPSHKAPSALVYDEFGTWGYIDTIEGQTANISTISSRGSEGVTKRYVDEQVATRAEKTVVKTLTATTQLATNIIFKADTMASVAITLPTLTDDFICQVEFTSGTSATSFTAPASIKWKGDDTDSGALVPQASSRYVLMFFSDGVNMRGISQKVGA